MKKQPGKLTPTRRQFLEGAAAASVTLALPLATRGESIPELASDPMRPQFHLLPARNWMNDPNGPIFFNGQYHMFFQYNPHGATWGDMSWNHAVSPDMLHWQHLPLAMTPTPDSPDSFGVFSGSAIAVGKRVYFVYTGTRLSTPELATIRDGTDRIQESQCLAWSDDPDLLRWNKDPKPIIPLPPPGMAVTGFRDPSAWKQGDWYYMTVGSGIARVGGNVLLYRSKDLRVWEYMHPLTSGTWNGTKTPNPCDDGEMWECPDFFALDGRHVLIYSTLGKVYWQSGVLDIASMKFTAQKTGLLDLDAFYAPKTQLDAHGRRILWGWIPERRSEAAMRAAGWSGMMSLPRLMSLDTDGTLRLEMLPESQILRGAPVAPKGSTLTLPNASGEFLLSAPVGDDFELQVTASAQALITATYSARENKLQIDGREVVLEPGGPPVIHAFVDGSVIELILSHRVAYTKRFYYVGPAPEISIRLSTPSLSAVLKGWMVLPISANRLTIGA